MVNSQSIYIYHFNLPSFLQRQPPKRNLVVTPYLKSNPVVSPLPISSELICFRKEKSRSQTDMTTNLKISIILKTLSIKFLQLILTFSVTAVLPSQHGSKGVDSCQNGVLVIFLPTLELRNISTLVNGNISKIDSRLWKNIKVKFK